MGAFLSLLSGLTQGAGGAYSKISEENRQAKRRKDELLSGSYIKRMEDENTTPEESAILQEEYYRMQGMKPADITRLMEASSYLREATGENKRRKEEAERQSAITTEQGFGPVPNAQEYGLPADFAMPTGPKTNIPQQKTLGDIPSRTQGEIKVERELGQKKIATKQADQLEIDKETNSRDATIKQAEAQLGRKLEEHEIQQIFKMYPRASTRTMPNTVYGRDYIQMFPNDVTGQPTDPNAQYRVVLDNATGKPIHLAPTLAQARGAEYIRDAESSTGYSRIYRDNAGKLTSAEQHILPPAAYLPNVSQSRVMKLVPQADGSTALVPVTEGRTSQKAIPGGQPPTSAPDAPAPAPGSGPRSGAVNPTSPLPTAPAQISGAPAPAPGLSAYVDLKEGVIVGGKPVTAEEKKTHGAALQGLKMISNIRERIAQQPSVLARAAMPGKPGARLFEKYKVEFREIISRIRSGMALNQQEMAIYKDQMPGLLDQLLGEKGTIEGGLKIYEDLFLHTAQSFGRRPVGSSLLPGDFQPQPGPKDIRNVGKRLTAEAGQKYLDENGGDKNKAREAAKADGWVF